MSMDTKFDVIILTYSSKDMKPSPKKQRTITIIEAYIFLKLVLLSIAMDSHRLTKLTKQIV